MQDPSKTPITYWTISGIALLWYLYGLNAWFLQNEAELGPFHYYVLFGLGVISGLLGSIALLSNSRWASTFFIVSAIAMTIKLLFLLFAPDVMDQMGIKKLSIFLVINFTSIFLFSYAKKNTVNGILT